MVNALKPGEVALLENLRFHPEEEKNDPGFAKRLAELGDAYVDDAFSAVHRAHASIEALAHLLPAAAGKNMRAELEALGAALENPEHRSSRWSAAPRRRPSSTCLKFMTGKVDKLAIGGAMANTIPVRAGQAGRPLPVRARPRRHGARDPGRSRERLRDHPARRRGHRREAEPGVATRTVGVNAVPATR